MIKIKKIYNYSFYLLLAILFFAGCKSKQNNIYSEIEKQQNIDDNATISTDLNQVALWLQKHRDINRDFSTLSIDASIDFSDTSTNQSGQVNIQIEKGKQILITVKAFLLTVAKVYISPERVSYYDIINRKYYDGDFKLISNLIDADVDYNQVEQIFLGETILSKKNIYGISKYDNDIVLLEQNKKNKLTATFNKAGELLNEKVFINQDENWRAQLIYQNYTNAKGIIIPNDLHIITNTKRQVNISINYKSISVNKELRIKYKIPENATEITL